MTHSKTSIARLSWSLPVAVLITGCTLPGSLRVEDSLVSELSVEQKEGIRSARAEHDLAEDSLAAARRETRLAKDQITLAASRRGVVKAQVEHERLHVSILERGGSVAEHERALERLAHAEARLQQADRWIELCDTEHGLQQAREELARSQARLRAAQVDLEKVRAIQELDRVVVQTISTEAEEARVARLTEEVQEADERVNAALVEVVDAQERHDRATERARSLVPGSAGAKTLRPDAEGRAETGTETGAGPGGAAKGAKGKKPVLRRPGQ